MYSGWLGSQMKYLNKYSKLWNEMNCTTINVIDTRNFFRQFFVPGRRAEVSAIILKQLAKGMIFIHFGKILELFNPYP